MQQEDIKRLLVEACGSEEVLAPGVDLIESGLLDSLALISFLSALEDMDIAIQPTQVDPFKLHTLEGILQLVEQYRA